MAVIDPRPTAEELDRLFLHEGLSSGQIAFRYGVSGNEVIHWLRACAVEKARATSVVTGERPSSARLRELYWKEKRSLAEIGRLFGVYPKTVRDWMEAAGIRRRALADALRLQQPQRGAPRAAGRLPSARRRKPW